MDTHTYTHTYTQDNYSNPRCACTPRVNNNNNSTCSGNEVKPRPLSFDIGSIYMYVSNMLYHRFTGFLSTALLSSSTLVRSIFNESMYFTYSSTGYNFRYGYLHNKAFCIADFNFGSIIRHIRCYYGLRYPFEYLIEIMSCH